MSRINRETDGRVRRYERTHALIVESCRRLMTGGRLQPSMVDVSEATGRSVRSIFEHFQTNGLLLRAALDGGTRDRILVLVLGPLAAMYGAAMRDRIVNALVLGEFGPADAIAMALPVDVREAA